jgi:hypothetical protein
MPRFLERDEAEREPPCESYPWMECETCGRSRGFRRVLLKECIDLRLADLGFAIAEC